MKAKERQIDKLYRKYEYLANIYAHKIFSLEAISYDRDDVMQDFKAKLFGAIVSYIRQFAKFRRGERNRPMLVEPYLRLSMSNYVVDFIKKMNQMKHNGWNHYLSIERDGFDYSRGYEVCSDFKSIVDFKMSTFDNNKTVELNGVNILDGLSDRKSKMAFLMYLKGFKMRVIDSVLDIKSGIIIRSQIEKLKDRREELFDIEKYNFAVYDIEENS